MSTKGKTFTIIPPEKKNFYIEFIEKILYVSCSIFVSEEILITGKKNKTGLTA